MTSVAAQPSSVRPLSWWPVAAAGAALTAAMMLSPVSVVACVALALMVRAACRHLTGAERTAVWWVLVLAIALRVLAITVLFAQSHPGHVISFAFDGDGWFMKQRSIWIRNVWLGVPVTSDQRLAAFEAYGWTSYIYILAYLQYLLSPAPYAIHLFNVVCYVGAAVLLWRLVRRSYGSSAALVALTLIVFMPTLFMWSVSALKEPLYLLVLVLVPVGLWPLTSGATLIRKAGGIAIVAAAAALLDTIRSGSVLIVILAVGIATAGTFVTRRRYLLLLTLLLLPLAVYAVLGRPFVQAKLIANLQTSASLHLGNVHTTGHGYKLLDQRFYAGDPVTSMTWPEAARFAVRAVGDFVVVPWPWQLSSRAELMFAPQQMLWYLLVPLAVVGIAEGLRRDAGLTWMLIGLIGAGAAAIAPNEGNIGTMVRHRDGIVPFVACLSALGLVSVLSWAGLFTSPGSDDAMADAPSTVPLFPTRPRHGLASRIAEGSVAVRAMKRLAQGSVLYALGAAILRPTSVAGPCHRADADRDANAVLQRVVASSAVFNLVRRAVKPFAPAWPGSLVGEAIAEFRHATVAERLRRVGWMLLIATVPQAALAQFGDPARPTLLAWALTLIVALSLVTLSRPLARASQERDAGTGA